MWHKHSNGTPLTRYNVTVLPAKVQMPLNSVPRMDLPSSHSQMEARRLKLARQIRGGSWLNLIAQMQAARANQVNQRHNWNVKTTTAVHPLQGRSKRFVYTTTRSKTQLSNSAKWPGWNSECSWFSKLMQDTAAAELWLDPAATV